MTERQIRHDLEKADHPIGIRVKDPRDILPPIDFTYGHRNDLNEKGVSRAIRHWNVHCPSRNPPKKRNYIEENKHLGRNISMSCCTKPPMKLDQSIESIRPCGMKSGEDIPIKGLINNEYGNSAEIMIKKKYDAYLKEMGEKRKMTPYNFTKTSEERRKKQKLSRSQINIHSKDKSINKTIPKPPTGNKKTFNKLDLPRMYNYNLVESVVKKGLLNFKTYHVKKPSKDATIIPNNNNDKNKQKV